MDFFNPILLEDFRTFFVFFTFDFPGICRNLKHDISKTKQANVLKFLENPSTFKGPT